MYKTGYMISDKKRAVKTAPFLIVIIVEQIVRRTFQNIAKRFQIFEFYRTRFVIYKTVEILVA